MNEALVILQEECAEVIQAASKCLRFGVNDIHNGVSNIDRLEQEIGDVLALIDVLQRFDMVSYTKMDQAASDKLEKLKKWSKLGI